MRKLHINVASKPFQNFRLLYILSGLIVAGLVVFTVYNAYVIIDVFVSTRGMKAELKKNSEEEERIKVELQDKKMAVLEIKEKRVKEVYQYLDGLLRSRAFSWTLFFNEIEHVIPQTVKIASVAPNAQGDRLTVTIRGLAKKMDGMLAFPENLEKSMAFKNATIWSEEIQADGSIAFNMKFEYYPEKAVEAMEKSNKEAPVADIVPEKKGGTQG